MLQVGLLKGSLTEANFNHLSAIDRDRTSMRQNQGGIALAKGSGYSGLMPASGSFHGQLNSIGVGQRCPGLGVSIHPSLARLPCRGEVHLATPKFPGTGTVLALGRGCHCLSTPRVDTARIGPDQKGDESS